MRRIADANSALLKGYGHNALGQRLFKTEPQFPPAAGDEADPAFFASLLAEVGTGGAQSTGTSLYFYLPTPSGPMPIAAITNGAGYAVHTDHLNTPRRLSNSSRQAAWQWAFSAIGDAPPTIGRNRYVDSATTPNAGTTTMADVAFNLRYPGQYFDKESGLSYNYFRSYDPRTGRYTQSDPIGLAGGSNRFGYANQNPLRFTDPLGLATAEEIRRAVATLRCANPDSFRQLANSITMSNMGENGAGMTDWRNNITLNSRLYGDNNTPVIDLIRSEFLQTLAHEMLHVNQSFGARVASNSFRMGNPLGYFHRQLDAQAEAMITRELLNQYNQALQSGDAGCTCSR